MPIFVVQLSVLCMIACVLLYAWTMGAPAHELFTDMSAITEASVQEDIKQIRIQQQLFGFPTQCKHGGGIEPQTHTKLKCESATVASTWQPSEAKMKACFSKVVPLLEATKCHVHQGTNALKAPKASNAPPMTAPNTSV